MTRILIADDEKDIRDLVAFTLQFAGFEAGSFHPAVRRF